MATFIIFLLEEFGILERTSVLSGYSTSFSACISSPFANCIVPLYGRLRRLTIFGVLYRLVLMHISRGKSLRGFIIFSFIFALLLGIGLGAGIGGTVNVIRTENFTSFTTALPTKVYDIKGRLITEFYAEEKRNPVSIRDLPPYLIGAFLTREDQSFYSHHGFTIRGILRAAIGKLLGRNLGGGSTITQQLAGTLYADRRDITLRRKFVELWWALQLERRYTKDEILGMYLNRMIMGPAVYGVEAASEYFFGHPAKDCTPEESAILAIQLSSPTLYNPFKNPVLARTRSQEILNQMVNHGIVPRKVAQESFNSYWDSFDYTRVATSAYFMRDDKAPWFSEYVRRQLESMLYGSVDIYSDGLSVYTTLDLDQQAAADAYMKRGIEQANVAYKRSTGVRLTDAQNMVTPIVEMLGLSFNLEKLFVSNSRDENNSYTLYRTKINPAVDAIALMFGIPGLKSLANAGTAQLRTDLEKSTIEGTLVTIDNSNGYIKALVGGSHYGMSNQLIRATQAKLMPGSTFKPLYYSAAIDSKKLTEGTMIYDTPTIFYNEDGTPYIPLDFKGEWKGTVLAWQALANSMNVPSVKVLNLVGFDLAIKRAAALLGITDPVEIQKTFPRVYPLALGVIGATPLQMARAFSVFADSGRGITPISIRYVEDRNGNVILQPEKDAREAEKRLGQADQIVSPQNAAIMTDMLKRVTQSGTLAWATESGTILKQTDDAGKTYTIPVAGKTGTTQNWADAWTVGFSPYYTTAIWFGFDRPGSTLGTDQTGATIAAPVWAGYMRDIHKGLPYKNFDTPQSGLAEATVCAISGELPTQYCDQGTVRLLYLDGTQPVQTCTIHTDKSAQTQSLLEKITGTNTSIATPHNNQGNGSGAQSQPSGTLNLDSSIKLNLP
jgi:penicillin-binding protein 1A